MEEKTVNTATPPANFMVPLKNIILPPAWNRESAGNLNSLVTSMKTVGQLVALTVRPSDKEGQYELVDGRRRYMAMKEAGVKEAFVSFTTGDNAKIMTESIAANLNRENHTLIELATGFKSLIDAGVPNQEIAKICGVSSAFVSQHVGVLNLPEPALEAVRKKYLSLSHCRHLTRLDLSKENHVHKFEKLYEAAINGTSATDIEIKVQAFLDKEKGKVVEEKEKDTKTSKKKAPTKEKEKLGRPVKSKDYTELKAKINPVNKTTLIECLNANEERLAKSTSKLNQKFLQGVRCGLEMAAGLLD